MCTHMLMADEQFLLLVDVPIQDHAQQVKYMKYLTWIYLREITHYTTTWKTSIWA